MSLFDTLSKYTRDEKEYWLKELYLNHIKGLIYFVDNNESLVNKYDFSSMPKMSFDDLDIISENSLEIESLDRQILQYEKIRKWNSMFEKKADICSDSVDTQFGCYYYDIMFPTLDKTGIMQPLEFTIWQFFAFGFYKYDNIHFEKDLKHITELNGKIYKQKSKSVWEAFYNQIVLLQNQLGNICVLFGDSQSELDNMCAKFQFRYIRSKIKKGNKIKEYFIEDIKDIPENSNIVVINYVLSNSELKSLTYKLLSKLINKTSFITFLTLHKEYDLKEALEINNEARINNLKDKPTKVFNNWNKALLEKLKKVILSWDNSIKGIPFKYLVDYIPYNSCSNDDIDDIDLKNREIIWNFKNTKDEIRHYDHEYAVRLIAPKIAKELIHSFGMLLNDITLVCVPASNEESYNRRYGEFSNILCKITGMSNSFKEIAYIENAHPKHLGGKVFPQLVFNPDYFEGKIVILFDDIITTGKTLSNTKAILESLNAKVIGAIAIGLTERN